ncbi:MAG: LemA family protein [Candidatus Gastranaerophilales bacterium]|nr:LemA family protein [Candidatus Gastranaerophilales bacterium]
MTAFIILLIVALVCYNLYVDVIKKRNKVLEAFSGIDVQLKKRYDLIPNILFIAQKFMDHEKGLMEEITKLRTQAVELGRQYADIRERMELDNKIAGKMSEIMVALENYPDLKSDGPMMQAIQTYNEVEEHIAAARRFYNSAAQELKNAVEIFPSSVFASAMGIKSVPFIEAVEAERKPINAADYLK